jgi:hypothetical protein
MAKNAYTSKGERPNVSKNTRKSMRRDYMSNPLQRLSNQVAAWKAGKKECNAHCSKQRW